MMMHGRAKLIVQTYEKADAGKEVHTSSRRMASQITIEALDADPSTMT